MKIITEDGKVIEGYTSIKDFYTKSSIWISFAQKFKNGKKCSKCGSGKELRVHHKKYTDNLLDENMVVVLCKKCHNDIHDIDDENHSNESLIDSTCDSVIKSRIYETLLECCLNDIHWVIDDENSKMRQSEFDKIKRVLNIDFEELSMEEYEEYYEDQEILHIINEKSHKIYEKYYLSIFNEQAKNQKLGKLTIHKLAWREFWNKYSPRDLPQYLKNKIDKIDEYYRI